MSPPRVRPRASAHARRALVVAVVTAATLLALATSASAHATLVEVRPADGAQVPSAPPQVVLRFDEPVVAPPGGVRVFDGTGERVDEGDPTADEVGTAVSTPLADDLGEGTYVVTYRVTSADGHPLRGATLFVVGDGEPDTDLAARLLADEGGRGAAAVALLTRWASYLVVLGAGGAAMAAAALRRRGTSLPPGLVGLVRWGAAAAIALAAVAVAAQAAVVSGAGIGVVADGTALRAAALGPVGRSAGLRALAAAALLLVVPGGRAGGRGWTPAAAAGAVAVAAFSLEGHTLTTRPAWVVWPADVVHLLAAAVWVGALIAVVGALAGGGLRTEPLSTARVVAAVSGLAGTAVVGVAVAGLALGWVEVRAVRALTSTAYGWTLVAKLALAAPVAAAAVHNRRRLVPAVIEAGRPAGASVDAGSETTTRLTDPTAAARRLRRSLRLELTFMVAVLAATSVLVGLQPAAEAAGVTGAYSTFAPLGTDGSEIDVTVDPNRAGRNEMHLYVLGPDGRQVDVPEPAEVLLELPSADIGPLTRTTTRLGPGHFLLSGPELSVPGLWDVTVRVPLSNLEVPEATITVPVNP